MSFSMSSEEESSRTLKRKGPLSERIGNCHSANYHNFSSTCLQNHKTVVVIYERARSLERESKRQLRWKRKMTIKGRGLFNFGTLPDSCEIYSNNIPTGFSPHVFAFYTTIDEVHQKQVKLVQFPP